MMANSNNLEETKMEQYLNAFNKAECQGTVIAYASAINSNLQGNRTLMEKFYAPFEQILGRKKTLLTEKGHDILSEKGIYTFRDFGYC